MKRRLSLKPMNFEQWAELATNDPAEFEAMRRAAIDEFLNSVSDEHRERLQCLQWRVDRVRERCTTPMAATIAISGMMWEAFYTLHDRYQSLCGVKSGNIVPPPAQTKSAKILPFSTPVVS